MLKLLLDMKKPKNLIYIGFYLISLNFNENSILNNEYKFFYII